MRHDRSFYVAGGTLRPDAPSYVERAADRELYGALHRGECCYVLTSRQMGKSSLMVRTARRLEADAERVVILDLTAIGQHLTPDQWYQSLLSLAGEQLGVEDELLAFWVASTHLGPMRRWLAAMDSVTIGRSRLIIFVDEVDALRSLPFSADEFLAGVRERSQPAGEKSRLVFCLLGVALPSELISDIHRTPFNVGRRIELHDFTVEEAVPLASGLRPGAECGVLSVEPEPCSLGGPSENGSASPQHPAPNTQHLLQRILYWTGGHPYLTQRLCLAVAEEEAVERDPVRPGEPRGLSAVIRHFGLSAEAARVDRACERLFFEPRARQREENLLFVSERILRSGEERVALLDLYRRVRGRRPVPDDGSDARVGTLRLAGLVRSEGGRLRTRNRLYARVFDRAWIEAHLPGAELRRQRAAFRRGLERGIVIAGAVALMIGGLGAAAKVNGDRAERSARDLEATLVNQKRILRRLQAAIDDLRVEKQRVTAEAANARRASGQAKMALQAEQRALGQARNAAREAREQRGRAVTQQRIAEQRRRESLHEQARLQVAEGMRLAEAGDPLTALPALLAAAQLESHDSARSRMHRIRLSAVLAQVPDLLAHWRIPGRVRHVLFSPDSQVVAAVAADSVYLQQVRALARPPLRLHFPGRVERIAFSPDSRWLATGSDDGFARLWDARTGQPAGPAMSHGDSVMGLAFNPVGERLATVCRDGTLRLWDLATGAPVARVRSDTDITSLAFDPSGSCLATTEDDGSVRLRSAETAAPLRTLPHRPELRVHRLLFSSDGSRICTVDSDGGARLWTVDTGRLIRQLGRVPVRSCAVAPRQPWIQILGVDHALRMWDMVDGSPLDLALRTDRDVTQLDWDADGARLLTVSQEGMIESWDPTSGAPAGVAVRLPGPVQRAAWDAARSLIATSDTEGNVRIWRLTSRGTSQFRPAGAGGTPALRPDGRGLATLHGQEIVIQGIPGARRRLSLPGQALFAGFSADGARIIAGDDRGTARVWDAHSGMPLAELPRHPAAVQAGAVDRVGRLAITGASDLMYLWDLDSGRLVGRPAHQAFHAAEMRFVRDHRVLVLARHNSFFLFEVGARGLRLLLGMDHARYATPDRDGKRLVVASEEGNEARLLDLRTLRPIGTAFRHRAPVNSANWSPDERRIVTASDDSTAQVWEVRTGTPIGAPMRHASEVLWATFSPDARMVVTSTRPGAFRLWDARTGEPLTASWNPERVAGRAKFSPGSDRLLIGLSNGHAFARAITPEGCSLRDVAGYLAAVSPRADSTRARVDGQRAAWNAVLRRSDRVDASAFHRQFATLCERTGRWLDAEPNLGRMLEVYPDEPQFHFRHGRVLAELGRWREAAASFGNGLRLSPANPEVAAHRALCQLAADDRSGYVKSCQSLVSQARSTGDRSWAAVTARVVSVGARPIEAQQALQILEPRLVGEPGAGDSGHVRAALLHRAGRDEEALRVLQALPEPERSGPRALVLRAAVCRRLGRDNDARQLYSRAIAASLHLGWRAGWEERLEIAMLLREMKLGFRPREVQD